MRRVSSCAAAVCVFAAALAGCRSGPRVVAEVPPDLRASAIAVYPFGFRWQEPAYRSFELSLRLVTVVVNEVSYHAVVVGPSEFQIYRPDDDRVLAATTLGRLLPQMRMRPHQLLVLRPWAEKRVHASSKTLLNAKGKAVGAERQEETKYVGYVDVIHAATGEKILEVSGETIVDPFAERDDDGADPAPELTALMVTLTGEAVERLLPHLSSPGQVADLSGYQLSVTPAFALAYEESGRPPVAGELARLDALDRELFLQARARYAAPEADEDTWRAMATLPPGLLVRSAPEGDPLRPGDVVVKVNDGPALPQAFVRARLLQGADALRVRRASGDYEEVTLP